MDDLFIKSHGVLADLVKWISTPILIVPREDMPCFSGVNRDAGLIISKEVVGGTEYLMPFDRDMVALILKTFCESHSRISVGRSDEK